MQKGDSCLEPEPRFGSQAGHTPAVSLDQNGT